MKGLVRRIIGVLGLVLLTVPLVRCTGSTDPDPPQPPYTLTDSTIFIPQEDSGTILDYSPEGTITLDLASEYADSIQVDDILIGQNDEVAYNGFLRKVTSISRERDGLVLETEPAQLMEAFESLHISETLQLHPSDIRSHDLRKGVVLLNDPDDEWFILSLNLVLYDHDDDYGTTNDQIRVAGVDSFRIEIPVNVDGDLLDLHYFEISLKTEARVHLQLEADIEGVTIEESYPLGEPIRFARIPIPGVPIYITPKLTPAVHINGDLSVSFETSLSYTDSVTNGIGWNEDDHCYAIHEDYQRFTFEPPQLTGELDFEVGPSLRLTTLIYDAVGPFIEGRMALDFQAGLGSDPCDPDLVFSLNGILYAVAGLEFDCFILNLSTSLDPYLLYSTPLPGSPWSFDLSSTGTIHMDPNPDHLNAPWILSGPCDFYKTGNGDSTFTDLLPGEYSVDWGIVPEWTSPPSQAQTLQAEGNLTYSGYYSQGPIDPEFVLIEAGTFLMGAPEDELGSDDDERPQHWVTLTHDFYIQATEVTNQQYADLAQWALSRGHVTATSSSLRDALDGSTQELLDMDGGACEISYSSGVFIVDAGKEDHPVKVVTWYGAARYCDWLSLKADPHIQRAYEHNGDWACNNNNPYTAVGYRLPTEAEWECACRAGTTTPFNTGDCLDAGTEANYNGNHPYTGCPSGTNAGWTVPVGSYPDDPWGLNDMHGNLWEWCNDWYDDDYYYDDSAGDDPAGSFSGSFRVIRGGSWYRYALYCRSANRYVADPNGSYTDLGFRPARSAF